MTHSLGLRRFWLLAQTLSSAPRGLLQAAECSHGLAAGFPAAGEPRTQGRCCSACCDPVPGATSSLSSYSVGHAGPALIWRGENHMGGVGQWAIVEAAYHGKFNRSPGHPQVVCAACPLSSCPPHPEPPNTMRSWCLAVHTRIRQQRHTGQSRKCLKALISQRCLEVHQSLRFRAKHLLQAQQAPGGTEGSPHHLPPWGTRSSGRARGKTGKVRLGNGARRGGCLLPTSIRWQDDTPHSCPKKDRICPRLSPYTPLRRP